jgi:nitrogen fixation/metabolism regulation signal transduction histidine kinase
VYQHNKTALRLLGLFIFTHIKQLEKIDDSFPAIFASLKAGDNRRISYTNERGTAHLVINVTTISVKNKILRVLAINDIESELSEKEVESWVRLVRVLTHEIMNSVAPITSLSETLLNYFRKQTVDDDFSTTMITGLETINETGKGLISFVESYRKFTGIRQPEKGNFALKNCLERVVLLMQLEHNFGQADIQASVEPDDLQLFADERQITQMLVNLVKNALQAIGDKPGGKVTIRAGRNESERIFIEVRDNGKGIPPELIDDIFVPFFTTKEKGSGVGLSVSRYIMRLHNGSLQLHSSPNQQGAVFVMTF